MIDLCLHSSQPGKPQATRLSRACSQFFCLPRCKKMTHGSSYFDQSTIHLRQRKAQKVQRLSELQMKREAQPNASLSLFDSN